MPAERPCLHPAGRESSVGSPAEAPVLGLQGAGCLPAPRCCCSSWGDALLLPDPQTKRRALKKGIKIHVTNFKRQISLSDLFCMWLCRSYHLRFLWKSKFKHRILSWALKALMLKIAADQRHFHPRLLWRTQEWMPTGLWESLDQEHTSRQIRQECAFYLKQSKHIFISCFISLQVALAQADAVDLSPEEPYPTV